jgi:CubicO group peptidase (beta-lactamase class C family)
LRSAFFASILVIGGCVHGSAPGGGELREPPVTEPTNLLSLMDSAGIPGMAMAVLDDGEVAWSKGFGVRGADDGDPVDENTVFEAASLSKPIMAYVALTLVDAGLLDLDRPLVEYADIPELPDERAGRITARMVLSHTTGLQNERINDEPLALAFDPGQRFRYSGEGFLLLQRVLESIAEESLDSLSRRTVLDALGMTRSGFVWREEWADNAAVGHGDFESPRSPSRPATARAPSSFHTTAHDYATFVRAVMRGHGLRRETFEQMVHPHVKVADGIDWGLGWALETSDGARALWHWGDNSNSGFTAFVYVDLDRQDGVVYFANSSTGLGIVREALAGVGASQAAPAFMGYEPYNSPTRIVRHRLEESIRSEGVAAGLELYNRLQNEFAASAFPESLLNTLGYRFLALDRPGDAVALFERNVREFPGSSNAYDSLGDGLVALGDKEGAITSYRRSHELDPGNQHARSEAERLAAEP